MYDISNSTELNSRSRKRQDEDSRASILKRLLPSRQAKENIGPKIQQGLVTPEKKRPFVGSLEGRLRLTTDPARSRFVLHTAHEGPELQLSTEELKRKHVKKHKKDCFIPQDATEPATPTQFGIPTRRFSTPGGTVRKAILVAENSELQLFQDVPSPMAKGSLVQSKSGHPPEIHNFHFRVTPQDLIEAQETKRGSQNNAAGMSATQKFRLILQIADDVFELNHCVRDEDGVLRVVSTTDENTQLSSRDIKRDSDVLEMHHCHKRGDKLNGLNEKENLMVGTPGSNFMLFAYLEAHIQKNRFFQQGHSSIDVYGQVLIYKGQEGGVTWELPLRSRYEVQWGNGRKFQSYFEPMDLRHPTYSAGCLVGDLIEMERTPKKVKPDDQIEIQNRTC